VITNPSFEANPIYTGWTGFGASWDSDPWGNGFCSGERPSPPDGVQMGGKAENFAHDNGGLYQVLTGLIPGMDYQLSVKVWRHTTDTNNTMVTTLGVDIQGGTSYAGRDVSDSYGTPDLDQCTSEVVYSPLVVDFTATQDTATLFLHYSHSGGSGFCITYFDDVQIAFGP
jgi:hypothetical protein